MPKKLSIDSKLTPHLTNERFYIFVVTLLSMTPIHIVKLKSHDGRDVHVLCLKRTVEVFPCSIRSSHYLYTVNILAGVLMLFS